MIPGLNNTIFDPTRGAAPPDGAPPPGGPPQNAVAGEGFLNELLALVTQDQKGSEAIPKGGLKDQKAVGPKRPAKNPEVALPSGQKELNQKREESPALDSQAMAMAASSLQPVAMPQARLQAAATMLQASQPAVALNTVDAKAASGRRNTPTTELEMIQGSSMKELLSAANRDLPTSAITGDPRMRGAPLGKSTAGLVVEKSPAPSEPAVAEMAAILDRIQSRGLMPRGSVAANGASVDALVSNKSATPRSEIDSAFAAAAALTLPVEVMGVDMGNRIKGDSRRDSSPTILGGADLLNFLGGLRGDLVGVAVDDPRNELTLSMSAADSGNSESMIGQHQNPELVVKGALPEAALVMNSAVVAAPTQTPDLRNQWELATVAHELARNGGGTVRLRVKPEGLGEITMSVTQGPGKGGRKELALQIVAETNQAREMLLQGMPGLNQALKSKDYDLKAFDVAVQDGVSAAFAAAVVERLTGSSAGISGSDFTNTRDGGSQQQSPEQNKGSAWERYQEQAQHREQRGGRRPWETWLAS